MSAPVPEFSCPAYLLLLLALLGTLSGCSPSSRGQDASSEDEEPELIETLPLGNGSHWILGVVPGFETVYYQPVHGLWLSKTETMERPMVCLGRVERRDQLELAIDEYGKVTVVIRNSLNRDVPVPETHVNGQLHIEFSLR